MQQLKDLEHIPEEINKLMGETFSQGKGASCDVVDISISNDDEEDSKEDVDSG